MWHDWQLPPTQRLYNLIAISYRENICISRAKYPKIRHGQRLTGSRLSELSEGRGGGGRQRSGGHVGWKKQMCAELNYKNIWWRQKLKAQCHSTPTHSALHFNFTSSFSHVAMKNTKLTVQCCFNSVSIGVYLYVNVFVTFFKVLLSWINLNTAHFYIINVMNVFTSCCHWNDISLAH